MKIGIISDTHNNWANFKKVLDWMNKNDVEEVLHCGDIQTQEMIDNSQKLFNGNITFAKGNGDFNLEIPEVVEKEIAKKKIAFCHFPEVAKKLAQSGKFDLVFYGHTHRPWDEKIDGCHMVNPGELAGQFNKPTFAVYNTETENLELKILEKI